MNWKSACLVGGVGEKCCRVVTELREIEEDLERNQRENALVKLEIESMLDELHSITHPEEKRPKAA